MNYKHKLSLAFSIPLVSVLTLSYQEINTRHCGLVFDSEKSSLINSLLPEQISKLKSKRSVNATDICIMPTAKLEQALNKISQPKPDHPGKAMAFRYQEKLSKNGQFNIDNWSKSQQQVKNMQRLASYDAGLTSELWQELGPGNIGGRIRSFAFDPTDSNRIIAGSVSGGLWQTTNLGQSWSPVDDFMANLSISSVIFDPNDTDIVYAGTGEGTFNADNVRGYGVFRSNDKGQSWQSLAATAASYDFYWVNRLVIPAGTDKLFAATETGIWRSLDGGESWSQSYQERTNDIDVAPDNAANMIAGTWQGVVYSTDAGDTWTSSTGLDGISGRTEVAYATSDSNIVYASIDNNSGEVYKSTDGGQSFSLVNSGTSYLGSQGWYDNALWVDPVDANHIIVGGIDLFRSTNGGQNLTQISSWWAAPDSAHADHHFILQHPDYDGVTNKQVFFANDGGMYTAQDVTSVVSGWIDTGWQELNNQLSITQFYSIGVAPDGTIIAGTQDNGTLVYKTDEQGVGDSEAWYETFGGDGGYSAADPTDSNYLYGEYVYLNIHRSTNGGGANSSNYIYDAKMEDGALFIAPFILDPNNPNRLLGGAAELWVSDNVKDFSPSWTSLKGKTTNQASIKSIAVAKGNSDLIYIGHQDGEIYKTIDGTSPSPTWTQVDTVDMPGRSVMRIAIDNNKHDTLYASFSGYESGNLWKSSDAGQTWSQATGSGLTGLPPAPVRTIALHPSKANWLYVGTEVGIFSSQDGGNNWSVNNDGPANVSVDELIWQNDNTLLAATHGRGVFRATLVEDMTPDSFSFESQLDTQIATQVTSETKTVTGITQIIDVTVENGEYSLDCASDGFTSAPGKIRNGQSICLRHTSSAQTYTETVTSLTLGDSQFSFTSKTLADVTPDDITISAKASVEPATEQTSEAVTVTGIDIAINLTVSNGEYALNCDPQAFTSEAGTIGNNENFCVRHTSASGFNESVTSTVTLNETSVEFTSTTRVKDETPDSINIASLSNVETNSQQTSASYTISGIDDGVEISVTGGEYSLGCSDSGFTAGTGTVNNNDTFCLRHTSSASFSSSTTTLVTIGASSFSFSSTTKAAPATDSGGSSGGGSSGLWLILLGVVTAGWRIRN